MNSHTNAIGLLTRLHDLEIENAALLVRVEAAEAAVRRVEALAEQMSRSRGGWDAHVAADIRSALDGTA